MQQLSHKHLTTVNVGYNNNALTELNDCIKGLLHLGPNVITFRTVITLRPSTTLREKSPMSLIQIISTVLSLVRSKCHF